MEKLMVFDLQRFALHDGPGIRTTVFLKGCPLDCIWCHNPESKSKEPQLGFLRMRCIGCGKCAGICEHNVHIIQENGTHQIQYKNCTGCGNCTIVCPKEALKIYGNLYTADELLAVILKDRDFYERSGGGLTVSGGEPMQQFEALKELLKKAKEQGLHVCLDTSGQAPKEHYSEIAEYVDIFLFDYKLTDEKKQKCYTKGNRTLILNNLDYLCSQGKEVFLRCPIIPSINDTENHYKAIADLSQKYSSIRQVNLMMYHDMAKGKAEQIGEPYILSELKTIADSYKQEIYEKLASLGCLNLKES